MIVIGIIGVLATLAVISTVRARILARDAKAKGDVRQIVTAISLLQADTGKWPNGCPPYATANPEVNITAAQAGLLSAPTVGDQGSGCFWTATDVANWKGPYIGIHSDPWNNPYWFDPDYVPYQNCPSKTARAQTVVVESFGPNKTGVNAYDCDDIFAELK
jgi:type II secretory pathway pseudopilin PulG